MAANPLLPCSASWYGFTYFLSWSNNCEVAGVLSDIPFISVGILVFGISVLFLIVRRVSLSAIWLSFSALLSFVAVVLDLVKTLIDGMAINTNFTSNQAIIRAREVLFALSIGFRFLFYWSYVAEPAIRDLSTVPIRKIRKTNLFVLECASRHHSGTWMRWGLPGKFLGVGSLVVIIIITTLQIVWRVAPQFHHYSSVYGTDAALELLVSFLLLLKLLSNTLTLGSPDGTLEHTFMECLAPISGLLVKIAIGVGSLLCFAFTESTTGRLLQALEVCIIAIFVVVAAFLRHQDILLCATSSQDENILFTLPEPARGSTFRITLPLIETPRMSMVLGTAIQNKASSREVHRWSARRSLNHVSSWVSSKVSRNRTRYEDEEVRLWNAEKVKVDPPYTGNMDTEPARSSVSSMRVPKELLRGSPANYTTIISALDAQSAHVRSVECSIHSGQALYPSRADVLHGAVPLQVQAAPVHSPMPFGAKHAENSVASVENSPIYGLTGIQSRPGASGSRTSLDELLRQQDQLDQSIEALKLFSARASANSFHSSPRGAELTRSHSTGQRTVSSEVSLSNFPVPPWLTVPVPVPSLPSSRPVSVKRTRGRRARFAAGQSTPVRDPYSITPIHSASIADTPSPPRFNSIPHSPLGEENESLSAEPGNSFFSGSGATQYNVTSFIDGLVTPKEPGQESQGKSWWHKESGAVRSGTEKPPRRLPSVPRRLDGLPASPAAVKLPPLTRSSVFYRGDVVSELSNTVQQQNNDVIPRVLPVVRSSHAPVTDHSGGIVDVPLTGSQLAREANLLITVETKGADRRAQRTFVRPRPPPLVLQSYTEQSPGMPRVQVLTDD